MSTPRPPKKKIMQPMYGIIPYKFDCWADTVVHPLLLKSSKRGFNPKSASTVRVGIKYMFQCWVLEPIGATCVIIVFSKTTPIEFSSDCETLSTQNNVSFYEQKIIYVLFPTKCKSNHKSKCSRMYEAICNKFGVIRWLDYFLTFTPS